jgi:hypothetical protein
MNHTPYLKRLTAIVMLASVGFVFSCEQEENAAFIEATFAAEESMMDGYFEDADDLAGTVLLASDQAEGSSARVSEELDVVDSRICRGATITVTMDDESDVSMPIGVIVVDFGDGCTDDQGTIRKGTIRISFEGRRFRPESVMAITFHDYEVNGIILRGTRTLTNLTASTVENPVFKIQIANGSISWPDGSMATRIQCYERTWNRNVLLDAADDALIVKTCTGVIEAALAMNRRGVDYQVLIDEPLVYKRGCGVAVSGIKRIVETGSGKQILIDYGNGECDTEFTITVNGNIHTITTR